MKVVLTTLRLLLVMPAWARGMCLMKQIGLAPSGGGMPKLHVSTAMIVSGR